MNKTNIPPDTDKKSRLEAFNWLLTIIDKLRKNCPWDKKQTLESLRHLTIEETYELSDAILENDFAEIKKELGDLLLHIVLYAKIASEKNKFTITDVLNSICKKLIHRHPHIYNNIKVKDEEEVKQNWEKLKLKEKGNKSVLGGVPKSLPAMVKAMRIQEKTRDIGFDWDNKNQIWDKVKEELNEFKVELEKGDKDKSKSEFGDLLFSLVNYSRFMDINPEEALERTNKKFIKRFNYLESKSKKDRKPIVNMNLKEMNKYWEEAKLI